jgi:hypothetical protein
MASLWTASSLPEKVPPVPDEIEPERYGALQAETNHRTLHAIPIFQFGFALRACLAGNNADRSPVRGPRTGGDHIPQQEWLRRLDIDLVQSLTWHVHSFLSIKPRQQNSETNESGNSKNLPLKLQTIYSLTGCGGNLVSYSHSSEIFSARIPVASRPRRRSLLCVPEVFTQTFSRMEPWFHGAQNHERMILALECSLEGDSTHESHW